MFEVLYLLLNAARLDGKKGRQTDGVCVWREVKGGLMPKATASQHMETAHTRDHLMFLSELQIFMNFVNT